MNRKDLYPTDEEIKTTMAEALGGIKLHVNTEHRAISKASADYAINKVIEEGEKIIYPLCKAHPMYKEGIPQYQLHSFWEALKKLIEGG